MVSIVLDCSDRDAVRSTLASLDDLDWDPSRLEVVLVGSKAAIALVEMAAAELPFPCRLVAVESSGVVEACARGAAVASGEYLAFLAAGARPETDWLRASLDALRNRATGAAVAARIVDDDGRVLFDPATAAAQATGGDSPDGGALSASMAGMVVEARAFHWVGGFDENAASDAIGDNLGRRLRHSGFEVRSAADAVVRVPVGLPLEVADDHGHAQPNGVQRRHRVAIVCPDVLEAKMAGAAIRAWETAVVLSREHDVQLATIMDCELTHPDFPVFHAGEQRLRDLERWCDVLIFQGHVLVYHPWLRRSTKVLVADIYNPFHLEVLEQARDLMPGDRRLTARLSLDVVNDQLARADFFVCANERQRDFWLGQLAGCGRVNPATYDWSETLRSLVAVVPFGIEEAPPRHTRSVLKGVVPEIGQDDRVILWGGGVYNWLDPLTLLRAVDKLRGSVPNVRLYFMGIEHPNPVVPVMGMAARARSLAGDLGLLGTHVFINEGWVDYDDRQNYLLEADIGVSTHLDHIETAYSFRTRILDYLWASLPIVATGGDSFGRLIEERGLGLTVPAGDVGALEAALHRLLSDAELHGRCRSSIQATAPEFHWSAVLEPLAAFCRQPARAPDLLDPRQRAMAGDPKTQAMWGYKGWRHDLHVAFDHLRRREFRDLGGKAAQRFSSRLNRGARNK